MLRLPCITSREKSFEGSTVSARVAVFERAPEVPVISTVPTPKAAEVPADKVIVLVPEAAPTLKAATTPVGRPDAASVTLPLKPFCGPAVIMALAVLPCTRLNVAGAAVRV
jgi:hypothetical protein